MSQVVSCGAKSRDYPDATPPTQKASLGGWGGCPPHWGCARQKVQGSLGVSLHAHPTDSLTGRCCGHWGTSTCTGVPWGRRPHRHLSRGRLSWTADPPLRVTVGSHRPRPRLPGQSACGTRVRGGRTICRRPALPTAAPEPKCWAEPRERAARAARQAEAAAAARAP